MPAPSLRSTSSAANQTGSTFSVNKPAGTTDGDLLIAFEVTSLGGGTNPAAPTGWTLLGRDSFGTGLGDLACFYKVASSEPSSWTFNGSGGLPITPESDVWILCLSGAASPPEGITTNSGTSTTATATGRTTAAANEFIACAFAILGGTGATISPSGLTDIGTIGDNVTKLDAAYTTQAATGATGDKTATISASLSWGALLVTVAPSVVDPVVGVLSPMIVSTPSPPPFPGAVVLDRAPFGTAPPDVPNVGHRFPISTPSPPPFPGDLQFVRAPYGDPPPPPPPPVGYGGEGQFQASTPSPPPFGGSVLQVLNQFGQPAPAVSSGMAGQDVVSTPSPPPFSGQVIAITPGIGQTPSPAVNTQSFVANPSPPPFPGAVVRAATAPFGLAPLPTRPMLVQMPSPALFEGRVILGSGRAPSIVAPRPLIVRNDPPTDFPGSVQTTPQKRGQELRGAAIVATLQPPPSFPGDVQVMRPPSSAIRVRVPPVVVRLPDGPAETGQAIFRGGRAQQVRPPMPVVVKVHDLPLQLQPPIYWSGTHERPASAATVQVVATTSPPPFPGSVQVQRNPLGAFPIPARPVIVRGEPPTPEPGSVQFRKSAFGPPTRPHSPTIVALPGIPFEGSVTVLGGRSLPLVRTPSPVIVWLPPPQPALYQPLYGSGWSEPAAPPGPPPPPPPVGVVVLFDRGVGSPALTLLSTDCDCE